MSFAEFQVIATRHIAEACNTYDLAESAFKMMGWENVGADNAAWKEGPFLASPANTPDINHDHPYILGISDYQKIIGPFLLGEAPKPDDRGGIPTGLNANDRVHEHLLSSQTIIALFAILEAYEFELFKNRLTEKVHLLSNDSYKLSEILELGVDALKGNAISQHSARYERSPVKKRLSEILPKIGLILDKDLANEYYAISDRRVELAHGVDVDSASINEAIDIFIRCLAIGKELGTLFGDHDAEQYQFPSHIKIT